MRFDLLPVIALCAAWLGTSGCTTVSSYEPKATPGPAKPVDYPIYVYPEKIGVPRPFEVVGSMSIRDTPLTVFGGSFEGELNELRQAARKRGADAVKLTSVEQPDFLHAKYRMSADLIRFTEDWENMALTETQFRVYLQTQSELNPIEGVWAINDAVRSRVGIMRNETRGRREFVVFILSTQNPSWRAGDTKMELIAGERPGVYRGVYYFDDYRRRGVAFTLSEPRQQFHFPNSDDDFPTIFTRE